MNSDARAGLVAVMPAPFVRWSAAHLPLQVFELPVDVPAVEVALRHDADPVHRWLRGHVRACCKKDDVPAART